ncbi:MAG: glycosyl hydrolase family 65 protein [Clostridiaceae bacterium]
MKYGFFDDTNKEYVVTTPATPLPWINYLGNDGFFGLISNTCGGYSFYKDAKLRRITRFRYNNVPADFGGRYYYIKDGGSCWNPGFLPTKTPLDRFECRHGLGYSRFLSAKNGLAAELVCFVPLGEALEVHMLTLKNETTTEKRVSLTSAIEWCLWNAVDDAANFQRNYNVGEVEVENGIVYHKTEYRERRSHFAFFGPNCAIDGFDTDLAAFLGQFRSWENPETVERGVSRNSIASGWAPMASQRIDLTLDAGESRTILFRLGYVENAEDEKFTAPNVINKKKAYALMERFSTKAQAEEALRALRDYWDGLLSRFSIVSGDERLDRMINVWNQYQCMVTFNMSRSASYFESGTGRGMGFRDSCQDLLGFVHLVPKRARERILDIAAIQFPDGSTYHQYQPLTKRGNADVGTGFNDDPLWLVACVIAYLKETGDFSILDEPVPFDNLTGSEAPLMEHLRRSMRYTVENKGAHGLPLIGRADWNDCLNLNCFSDEPGESFQTCSNYDSKSAESVFIAAMFVLYGREYAALCARRGEAAESKQILDEVKSTERAVLDHGWDGEWFLRAYDAFGGKIGSRENTEGQIFVEPQGFCTMAGIGGEKLGMQSLDSVSRHLVGSYGVELLHPCYTAYRKELGEISSYPPGYKENGSVFCHNNPWVVLAYTKLGDAEHAFDIYRLTCPAYIEDASDVHRTEPYVYSQTIAGREAARYGEAKNSWLTGTAAWSFVAVTQGILGIIPEYNGLRLSPCLPEEIPGYSVKREFRGTRYDISVQKSATKKGLLVDGAPVAGTLIPLADAEICRVELFV